MQPRPSVVRSRMGNRLVHPGEILLEEFMRPFWISQNALARRIGVPPRRINEIVNGKRAITASTALGLGEALGPSPHFWMALQADYDIEVERARQANAPARPCKPFQIVERGVPYDEEDDEGKAWLARAWP
jgi:addiction module HigA family antidote